MVEYRDVGSGGGANFVFEECRSLVCLFTLNWESRKLCIKVKSCKEKSLM